MEVWLDSLNDILVPHVFKGLQEAYNSVNRLTGGIKVLLAFQVTLEGIKDLSQSKIAADYAVLVNTLVKNGHDKVWFETLLRHLYVNYGKTALISAGLNLGENFNTDVIEVPQGEDFVRDVYVNTAREIWKNPFLFNHKTDGVTRQNNNNEIVVIIRNSIMRTVRDGLNLNRLLTSYTSGKMAPVERKQTESVEDIRERFKRLNNDNLFTSSQGLRGPDMSEESYLSAPIAPSVCGTVDNDNLASDDDTISDDDEGVQGVQGVQEKMTDAIDTRFSVDDSLSIQSTTTKSNQGSAHSAHSAHTTVNQTSVYTAVGRTLAEVDPVDPIEVDLLSVRTAVNTGGAEGAEGDVSDEELDAPLDKFKIRDLDLIDIESNYTIKSNTTLGASEKISVSLPRSINTPYDENLVIKLLDDDLSTRLSLLRGNRPLKA